MQFFFRNASQKNSAVGRGSRSTSDKYTGKTGSQNEGAFQCSIKGILSSGEFSKSLANKQEAVGTYLARVFLDQSVYCRYPTFQALDLLPLRVGKPLFTNGSIVPRARGVRFSLAHFISPPPPPPLPLSYMKQVPFKSAGIRLQNMQKLSVYTVQGLRYMLRYADQKFRNPTFTTW